MRNFFVGLVNFVKLQLDEPFIIKEHINVMTEDGSEGATVHYHFITRKYHRRNGPGIEWDDGTIQWMWKGKNYNTDFDEWCKVARPSGSKGILLKLQNKFFT